MSLQLPVKLFTQWLWYLDKLYWLLHISSFQFLFQQLGMLVSFVRSHIRPYMDEIVTLMRVSAIFMPVLYCHRQVDSLFQITFQKYKLLQKFIGSAELHIFEVIIVFWNAIYLELQYTLLVVTEVSTASGSDSDWVLFSAWILCTYYFQKHSFSKRYPEFINRCSFT